jgi:hypothetical protein
VGVHVDQARHDGLAGGVDDLEPVAPRHAIEAGRLPDGVDAVVLYEDGLRDNRSVPETVDHLPTREHQPAVHGVSLIRLSGFKHLMYVVLGNSR